MLRALLEYIVVLVVARMLWRAIGGVIGGFSSRPAPPQAPPPVAGVPMVRDPVCGTFVLPERAVSIADGRSRVYFCSAGCRDAYRARTA
jgi:YHS domain-containing protein